MATHGSREGILKIGTDTVAEFRSGNLVETIDTASDAAQGDTADTHLPGLIHWTFSAECMWDETDTNGQEACTVGASVTIHFLPEGDTTGDDDMTGTATVISVGVALQSVSGEPITRALEFLGDGVLTHTVAA